MTELYSDIILLGGEFCSSFVCGLSIEKRPLFLLVLLGTPMLILESGTLEPSFPFQRLYRNFIVEIFLLTFDVVSSKTESSSLYGRVTS